ncbi:MAG: ketopantoate reductase family protein [Chloroflexi bacterium]|nr:ketopantoate reductase family protein [Chloroflexota bacterium]
MGKDEFEKGGEKPVTGLTESNRRPRFIIYGAGALGGVIGGQLALAGKEVVLIGRPHHIDTIREHGLRYKTPTGTHVLPLAAVTKPGEVGFQTRDVILLCVKGQDTDNALRELRAVAGEVPIFCCQNGVRNEEIASTYYQTVYGVMVRVGAIFVADGEVATRRDPPGWLVMARYPSGTDGLVEDVAADLRDAGFYVLVTSDVMPYKWGKMMFNLTNAISAITNVTGAENERVARAVQAEAQEIVAEAGICWISARELELQWPEITVPPRAAHAGEVPTSTWQSLARRSGTVEAGFLNGEIVRVARRLGKRAPMNETLLRIAEEMAARSELPGKYTPAEIRGLLGLADG